jgi:hypothetical protein
MDLQHERAILKKKKTDPFIEAIEVFIVLPHWGKTFFSREFVTSSSDLGFVQHEGTFLVL